MAPTIHLALVDDWEVRGNGSGHPKVLQFEPMQRLVGIFNRYGVKGSFDVEVMQQLTYRSLQERFPELKAIADEWDCAVTETFRQGHDIQLHLHPQWHGATYEGRGEWRLHGDWSIVNYSPPAIKAMLVSGKQYLEALLRKIDPAYACSSFRAGSWCVVPSDSLLPILSELGFVFDISIAPGIRQDTPRVKLDYTRREEPFLPYYPVMEDARRVSSSVESIVCIPTFTFPGARTALVRRDAQKAGAALWRKFHAARNGASAALARGRSADEWTNRGEGGALGLLKKLCRRYVLGQVNIADLSRMNYAMMLRMMASIRERAAKSGLPVVPIVLENHSKDILDFSYIERFIQTLTRAEGVNTVTLTEMAYGLRRKTFHVRTG
jgi:hypothetical protein